MAIDRNRAIVELRQVYGTMTASPTKTSMLLPARDPHRLDDRRQSVGLTPLEHDAREGINCTTVAAPLAKLAENLPDRG